MCARHLDVSAVVTPDPASLRFARFGTDTRESPLLASPQFFELLSASLSNADLYYVYFTSGSTPLGFAFVTESSVRLGPLTLRAAICGNPIISSDSAIVTLGSVDRSKLLPSILHALDRTLFARGVRAIVLKEIAAPESTLLQARYFKLPLEPALGIPVEGWNSFSQYTGSLTSHYRGLINRADRELNSRGIVSVVEDSLEPIAEDLYLLYSQVAHEVPTNERTPTSPVADRLATWLTNLPRRFVRLLRKDFFLRLKTLFPAESDVITLRNPSGELIASTANLQVGEVFHSIYIGMRRTITETPFVYRHLLAIKMKHAIERKARLMQLGRTCAKTKAELGAVAMPEGMYCHIQFRPLNLVLARAAASLRARQTPFTGRAVFRVAKAA